MRDFWGETIPDTDPAETRGDYKRAKKNMGYKRRVVKSVCCGTCLHFRRCPHHGKTYFKCKIIGITSSSATDIQLSCTCILWADGKGTE